MAWKVAMRGTMDNETTNTIFCDYERDKDAIPASEINLGTVAVVWETMQAYMANSQKQWKNFVTVAASSEETQEENEETPAEETPTEEIPAEEPGGEG